MSDAQARDALTAESAVIGSLLREPELVPRVLAAVNDEDFSSDAAREVFRAARRLTLEGANADPIAIRAAIGGNIGTYMAECMDVTPSPARWESYARIMHEQATLRRLQDCAARVLDAKTLEACQEPAAQLGELLSSGRRVEAMTLRDMLAKFAERQQSSAPKEYITFGFEFLDAGTFAEPGDVVMIGGAPSDGKTALALVLAYHMAKKYNVGFFSLETNYKKLIDRLVTSGMNIDFGRIKRGQMTEDDWVRFAAGCTDAEGRRLTVLRASGMTADQIAGVSKAYGFDVVFVDYVQLITPTSTKGASRAEQMADVSRALHAFAQSSGTLVVELAQLTRQERGSKRERDMFDLGESSQFEKDADLILLIYRPPSGARMREGDKGSEALDVDRTRILRVAKNKEGVRGRFPLLFDGAHQSFSLLAPSSKALMRDLIDRGRWAKTRSSGEETQVRFDDLEPTGDEPF